VDRGKGERKRQFTCATVTDDDELEAGVIDGLLIGQSLRRKQKNEMNVERKSKNRERSIALPCVCLGEEERTVKKRK